MTNPLDDLTVAGNATFAGASTGGAITLGTLRVAGDFTQLGPATGSFLATGQHQTLLNGSSTQTVRFDNPATSQFASLDLNFAAGGVSLTTDVTVEGNLIAGATTITGSGATLNVESGMIVDGLTLDRVLLRFATALQLPTMTFDNVKFQNYLATDTQFRFEHPGLLSQFTFTGLSFVPLLDADPGFYISAVDTSPGNLAFTITVSSDPGNGIIRTELVGTDVPTVDWQF